MPIHKGKDNKGYYYMYGSTGKKYYYDPKDKKSEKRAYDKALKQEAAIRISKQTGNCCENIRKSKTDYEFIKYIKDHIVSKKEKPF